MRSSQMKKYSFGFLGMVIFWLSSSNLSAQSWSDRFSLHAGFGINTSIDPDHHVAASLYLEPRMGLSQKISLGLRYDVGTFGIGRQRIGQSNDQYRIASPDLSLVRSAAFLGYFHFKILGANYQLGLGLQYSRTAGRLVENRWKTDDSLGGVEEFDPQGHIGLAVSLGVEMGPTILSAKMASYKRGSNTIIVDGYTNISVGYRLIGDRTGWRNTLRAERIPVFFLELGTQTMMPIFSKKNAAAFGAFLEPKIGITKRSSVGFKYDFDRARRKGLDLTFGNLTSGGETRRELRNLNEMSYTHSKLLTFDYYFPTVGGWYFVGAGAGEYKRDEMQELTFNVFQINNDNFEPLPEQKNIGMMLRAGLKTSLLRFALSYNYSGNNIPDYISFQVSFEPSFMKSEN